jgi:hypothetical protein
MYNGGDRETEHYANHVVSVSPGKSNHLQGFISPSLLDSYEFDRIVKRGSSGAFVKFL